MDKKNNSTTYRIPEDFNPYISADHVRALTDALHQLVTEGEMTQRPAPQTAYSNLVSLMELLQPEVHALHDYLGEIENRGTLNLPLTDEEFDAVSVEKNWVREESPIYGVC
ncbi:MAG TPA: hypothetical protein VF275_02220 [Gammaproteobacteria bacterium]